MVMRKKNLIGVVLAAALGGFMLPSSALAVNYGGVELPDGPISFADVVLAADQYYSGGPAVTLPNRLDPEKTLGAPDYVPDVNTGGTGAYSLGDGGMLTVGFLDNFLTNSGTPDADLWIFEVGKIVEDTFISVFPTVATADLLALNGIVLNPDGFVDLGQIGGGVRGVDIDTYLPGFAPGILMFNAVRLVDARSIDGIPSGELTGSALANAGADIDAIAAIYTVYNPDGGPAPDPDAVPEPATAALGLLSLGALTLRLGRRTRNA